MEPWIAATLAASAVQTLRFLLQKRLTRLGLSTGGATFARFLYGAPLAAAGALALVAYQGLPQVAPRFWVFAVIGGLAQIVATWCIVALFSERSFAAGIAFTKTEMLLVALFAWLVLGETVSVAGLGGLMIGVAGVLLLSRGVGLATLRAGLGSRAMGLGLLAGAFFGLSAVGYRGATLAVSSDEALLRAALTLALVTAFQTLAMGGWLAWRAPGEVGRVLRGWRAAAPVGLTGVLGSLGWFVAFALQNAAYVRAVGQVELVFGLLASGLILRERAGRAELAGIALLLVSIVVIVLAG